MIQKFGKEWVLFAVFAAVFILMSIFAPNFLTGDNLQSMAFQLPEYGILALAMMVAILTGGINLSLTYSASLSGIGTALVISKMYASGMNDGVAIAAGLLVGFIAALIIGSINGVFIAIIGVSPILVTLGTMMLFEGVGLNLTKGRAVTGFPEVIMNFGSMTVLGVPVALLLFIVIVIFTWILLEKTPWGNSVYMVGCNPVATNYSGINVKKVLFKVYIMSALLCFLASTLMMARYNSMKIDYGVSYLMQSVSAVVLGGTLISGGYGKVMGVVIAAATLQILTSGLNMLGLNRFFVDIIIGFILLFVLTLNFLGDKFKKKQSSKYSF